ncbi:hypothetical protein [Dyella japonica]|uniref:Uncharacterized protein n=1 Tax=Dyella japonica A8 TaxID=1217721 RepID=A0A075JYG3_9GAMM|nr:hypothetical protein [Dyella japonica]AIF47096.1 hypothetical protein HY57_07335 [Dyella japonica A8]
MTLPSPRSAAETAAVYRRRRAERPRDRWLRVVALVGALFVHLMFLIGVILGPAYELEETNEETAPLVVRLIEKSKEEPPPPPPVRGTPPKQVGPVHKGNANNAPRTARQSSSSTRTNSDLSPVPVPAMQTPVVTDVPKAAAPKPEVTAAPLPPVTVPKPAPAEQLQPVPSAPEPPQVTVEAPVVQKPVPPAFQPEPVRKPQTEGNQPMPPPASLAIPEVPAQSAPMVTPPAMAMQNAVPAQTRPSVAPVPRPEAPASPPEPEWQAVPMPAQAAPTVNLQPQPTTVSPVVPQEQPKIESPAIRVAAEAQMEAVPLPPNPQPSVEHPQAPRLDVPAPKAIALDNKPSIERPQLSETPAEATPTQSAATSSASHAPTQSESSAQANAASNAANPSSNESGESSAPNATPQGSSSGTPGQPNGVNQSPSMAGGKGLNLSLPPGQGNGQNNGPGHGQGGATEGAQEGAVGTYVQARPHGNTEIMSHGTPNIGYQATRFEKDWTPEGESSIDTALRHAVEKTTMRHTFNLPRGVRVECVVMPLFPMALFGCGDGNPPPKPVDDVVYDKMKLAPTNPLVPPSSSVGAAPTMATVKLDNAAQCAAARVAGGPLPPGCSANVTTIPAGPARSSTTWVPASDQFH